MFLGLESLAAPIIPKPVTAGTRPPTLVRFQEPSSPTNAWLAEIGPNHRIWTDVTIPTDSAGQPLSHGSNHLRLKNRIRDIGSGIHYWNGEQYVSSVATFEVSPDATAFMATKVQHKTRLAVNLNTPNAVTVSHNGVTLNSTPVAIGILDAVSGRTVIIAGITNCQGRLSSSNVVYYENALVKEDGTPVASILYTIERGSLAQDVVVTSRIDPADYDIPTGSARIQIWSEFYGQIPVPDRLRRPIYVEKNQSLRKKMAAPDLFDDTLGFSQLVFGQGQAYAITASGRATNGPATSGPTGKELKTVNNRHFIIENVRYSTIGAGLQALGPSENRRASAKLKRKTTYASTPPPFPIRRAEKVEPSKAISANAKQPSRDAEELAKILPRKPSGMLIDYLITIGGTINDPIDFAGDQTIFVSAPTYCNGAVTIEGGCVFKYPTPTEYGGAYLQINNTLSLLTASYRPAFFTAADDDKIGSAITTATWSAHTGTIQAGGYGAPALWVSIGSTTDLHDLVFRYAQTGLLIDCNWGGPDFSLAHSQFIDCITGVGTEGSGTAIFVKNCLFNDVTNALLETDSFGHIWKTFNCTFDNSYQVINSQNIDENQSTELHSTNCIFANTSDSSTTSFAVGNKNGFYNHSGFGANQLSNTFSPFQTVGAGAHYLVDQSPWRNAGANVPADLAAALKTKTTYPPLFKFQSRFSAAENTLGPQAQRDTDVLDLGFHFVCLDYEIGASVASNSLTILPGTAIAFFGSNSLVWGLGLANGLQLNCWGAPDHPVWITSFNSVQEGTPPNWWEAGYGMVGEIGIGAPLMDFRFTCWSSPAQDVPFVPPFCDQPENFRDCQFFGGQVVGWGYPLNLTNCLLSATSCDVSPNFGDDIELRNNLFRGGTLSFYLGGTTTASTKDNLFDRTSISSDLTGYAYGYNAFITNCDRLYPTSGSDIILTNTDFCQGPLGDSYYPTNGGMLSTLINAGSTNANLVSLYHYTTTTNLVSGYEIKETNTLVDIGFHYVATDSNGVPRDSDGDGTPDYLENSSGTGTVESGETDSQSPADLGLKVVITRPAKNSPIP